MSDRYEEMEPNALDDLVAERVMGWSYQTFPDGPVPHIKHWYATSPCPNDSRSPTYVGPRPWFSREIVDAWRVVEEMRGRGYNCRFHTEGPWQRATFTPYADHLIGEGDCIGGFPALFCIAALRALDSERGRGGE